MRWTAITLMTIALLIFAAAPGLAANQEGAKPNMEKLMNPAQLNETAPAKYQVNMETTKGLIIIEVTRSWAPQGADRFYNLVKNGYYDGCRFFRVVPDFMIQFGINGNPKLNAVWRSAQIPDDPVKQSNLRGYVTFAKQSLPNTRTTQLFINTRAEGNGFLDNQGFAPFGKVIKGMSVVDKVNTEYGEKPDQGRIQMEGNVYLEKAFPNLDYIKTATIVTAPAAK
jgi:peptidyl-prolyl cis-trans isomerase A (cyclophilin A)